MISVYIMVEGVPDIKPEPNQSFDSAVDLNIVGDIMSKVRRCPPETPEILEDQEAFMALSTKVILDLLENEPDTYTIDDVKVRFR